MSQVLHQGKPGKACDKKTFSGLNYVGHKTIHIDLPFTRWRESKHVHGTKVTMILYLYVLNVSRMLTDSVDYPSTAMYDNDKAFMFG